MAGLKTSTRSWIVWSAIALHLIWGAALIPASLYLPVTAISPLTPIYRLTGDQATWTAIILIAVGLLAAWGMLRPQPGHASLLALLPQQLVLVISAGSILSVAFSANIPPEVEPLLAPDIPASTVLVSGVLSNMPLLLVTVGHTLAILDLHGALNWKPWASPSPHS